MLVNSVIQPFQPKKQIDRLRKTQAFSVSQKISIANRTQRFDNGTYGNNFYNEKLSLDIHRTIEKSKQKIKAGNFKQKVEDLLIKNKITDREKNKWDQIEKSDLQKIVENLRAACEEVKMLFQSIKCIFQIVYKDWKTNMKKINERLLNEKLKNVQKMDNAYVIFEKNFQKVKAAFDEKQRTESKQAPSRVQRKLTLDQKQKEKSKHNSIKKMNQSQKLGIAQNNWHKLPDFPLLSHKQIDEASELSFMSCYSKKQQKQKINKQFYDINTMIKKMKQIIQIN